MRILKDIRSSYMICMSELFHLDNAYSGTNIISVTTHTLRGDYTMWSLLCSFCFLSETNLEFSALVSALLGSVLVQELFVFLSIVSVVWVNVVVLVLVKNFLKGNLVAHGSILRNIGRGSSVTKSPLWFEAALGNISDTHQRKALLPSVMAMN